MLQILALTQYILLDNKNHLRNTTASSYYYPYIFDSLCSDLHALNQSEIPRHKVNILSF